MHVLVLFSTYIDKQTYAYMNIQVYNTFFAQHTTTFPLYMEELSGVSVGSGVPFQTLFVLQLQEEFSYFITSDKHTQSRAQNQSTAHHNHSDESERSGNGENHSSSTSAVDHCTDVVMRNNETDVVGHNEDNSAFDKQNTVLIDIVMGDTGTPYVCMRY